LIRSYRKKYDIERANNECEIATSLAESIGKIERSELIILVDKEIMKKPEFCEAREYLKRIIRKYIRYRRFMLVAWLLFLVLTFTSIGLDMEIMTTIILLIITILLLSAWYCMMSQVFLGREKLYDTPLLKRYSKELDDRLTINNNVLIEAYRELYHVPQHSVQYDWLDIKPIFSMEDGDFCSWTMKNIKYPEDAVRKHIEGEVIVNFVINKQGQVEDIKITQSAHSLLDSEVVRVISQSPQWSPGKFRDIPVPATYVHKHIFKV
jgi:protein TonB